MLERYFPKRKRDFFGLLVKQMKKTLEGIEILEAYMVDGMENIRETADKLEHDADEIMRFIIDDLNHTFITPIDRVDIYSLSRSIDDVMDHAASTVNEMEVYELEPDDYVKMIVTNLKHATRKLYDSVLHLQERPNLANEAAIRSNLLIKTMEHLYHEAFKELAENGDISYMFKMREIYRRLFQIATSISQSNNILLDIIIKTA